MMYIPENYAGYFILFLNQVRKVMKHGMIKKRIKILVVPMPGPVSVLMKKKEFCFHQLALLLMIFMVVKERGKIFLPIVCLHWMPIQENASGIFKQYIMMYRTEICQRRRL